MKFSNSFKTYDTTYQRFQGQWPALSYEPIRALQCNLFSKYHPFQKNKNKNKKLSLANHSHSLWGSYVHVTNTCNEKKKTTPKNPQPTRVYTNIPLHTHPCKPWKLRKSKANKAIKKKYEVLFRKYSQSRYINMFYGEGKGKTGIFFQNSAEANGD